MENRIRLLSESLIGKIAAGEVVERPAAAIKELIENSLDAGATAITVEIRDGGISYFRVTDNGSGIDERDIRMVFERHATSKISTDEELEGIETLGFRGEAMASIAAVARVTLQTKTRESANGIKVVNEGGKITSMEPSACPDGTSTTVRDLFFNTPVRLHFLKRPTTEAGYVADVVMHAILSRPDVSFRYINQGKTVYRSSGDGDLGSAAYCIFGNEMLRKTTLPVDGHMNGMIVHGFVGVGESGRGNRKAELFFINGRYLESSLLSSAVEEGTRERVMIGHFPMCILHLTMPYENVDVNVHPNKLQVRFRKEAEVQAAVAELVREALKDPNVFAQPEVIELTEAEPVQQVEVTETEPQKETAPTGPETVQETAPPDDPVVIQTKIVEQTPIVIPTETEKPEGPTEEPAAAEPVFHSAVMDDGSEDEPGPQLSPPAPEREIAVLVPAHPVQSEEMTGPTPKMPYDRTPGHDALGSLGPILPGPDRGKTEPEKVEAASFLEPETKKPLRLIGNVFNTYILLEYADQLIMIDQHAAHERLNFDSMMEAYDQHRAGQTLLIPMIEKVTGREMSVLEENRELLERLGFTVEPFGANEVAIRSIPMILGEPQTAAFFREILDELSGEPHGFTLEKRRTAILQTACKHAVKGGEKLSESDMRYLVEQLIDRHVTPTCPHGRPLVVSLSHTELDRKFRRIQPA